MSWVDLEEIEFFEIPMDLLQETQRLLWKFGQNRTEGRVLWAGREHGPKVIRIAEVVAPKQENYYAEVIVEHVEIERINLAWCDAGLIPVGQVHTHPRSAWHSEEDDEFPISTQRGSLSFVIPDFAKGERTTLHGCALFRLTDAWDEIDPPSRLLRVVEA